MYYGSTDVPQVRFDLPVLFVRAGLDQPASNQHPGSSRRCRASRECALDSAELSGRPHDLTFSTITILPAIIEETFRFAQNAIAIRISRLARGLDEAKRGRRHLHWRLRVRRPHFIAKSLPAHPQDARRLLAYGIALTGAKRYKEARTQFDRALAIGGLGRARPGCPRSQILCARSRSGGAIAWLKRINRDSFQNRFCRMLTLRC